MSKAQVKTQKKELDEIESIFLALNSAQKEMDGLTENEKKAAKELLAEAVNKRNSLVDNLVAPDVNLSKKVANTLYAENVEAEIKSTPSTYRVFPSVKSMLVTVAVTAFVGFTIGAKIGLSIYYSNEPILTKVSLIDMVRVLF